MTDKKPKKLYGLSRRHTRKPSREYIDQDYIDKLSDKEKEYLDQFNREYYQNSFPKDDEKTLHPKGEERRKAYARENARNRDIWTKHQRSFRDLESHEHELNRDNIATSEGTRIKGRIRMEDEE